MNKFIVVTLSASETSVSRKAMPMLEGAILANGDQCEVVDIREFQPFWMNSGALDSAPEEYRQLAKKIAESTGVYFLTPIYGYNVASTMKLVSELYTGQLKKKPVCFITAAGTLRSHLAVGSIMQDLVFECETFVYPQTVQLTGEDINNDGIASEECRDRIVGLSEKFSRYSKLIKEFNNAE
jgi:NAD(P)H-dependent FMN reductase